MDDKKMQLRLEIELLLLHLDVPAEESRQKIIEEHKDDLNYIKNELYNMEPEQGMSMLNDLLTTMKWDYQVKFMSDETAREYVMNDPMVYVLFSLVLVFVSCPLKAEIDINQIQERKQAVIGYINKETLTISEGLEVMKLVRSMIKEIAEIVDKYETEAGRRPPKEEKKKAR